jgi:hypothetical protein
MSAATYGALFDQAIVHLGDGSREATRRLEDKDAATATVAAYSGLLDAARQHVWALIVPARVAGVAESEHAHPVEAAALAMVDAMPPTPDDLPPRAPILIEANHHPWDQAAKCLRAASDLLDSHHNLSGTPRTPDAELIWDDVARHSALGRLGGFVAELVSTQEAMALRVGQAGLRWERVGRWLPPEGRARYAALELARVAEVAGVRTTDLDDLGPASTTLRTGGPVVELGDRVARIRRAAWNLRAQPDYSVRTLFDVTHAGLQVAAHTAAFHGVDLNEPAATRHPYGRRTAAWLALLTDVRGYLGAGPGDSQIHADVVAVRELLAALVPDRPADHDRAASADPAERTLAGTLHGACAGLGRAAEWNAATFSRLARSGQIYLRVEELTRDELSEHTDLAATKLTEAGHHLIAAPVHRTERTLDLYRDVVDAGTTRADERSANTQPGLARANDGRAMSRELPSAS